MLINSPLEINELKAQSQEKDTIIRKLKERIKSVSGKDSMGNVKKDIDEIETINIELEHSVAKLLSENKNLKKEREHLKSIFKDQFDSIGKTRVQSKEHCDSLIAQINAKSVENSDLNAQLQEKIFAITALKNELRKLKRKNVVNIAISKPNATIDPGMFKLDIEALYPRLKNNRDAHEVYIEKTIEYTGTLRGFVESARTQNPSKPLLESSCMFTKHLQKLLVCVSQTCPSSPTPSGKVVSITPINKDKRVRLLNLSKPTTSASGSKPSVGSMCAICNKCLFDANHDMCLIGHVNDVNVRSKSKSKRNKKRKAWKPTGKVFTDIGYKWKPTGRLFTIVGSSCPLTRITPKKIVHLKKTTSKSVKTPKQKIKVYSRRPKLLKLVGSSKKAKIVESKIANNSESTHLWGSNATYVPSSSSLVNDMSSRSSSGIWTMDVLNI
ncbi:hypothetical protein Tco_0373533 [Tanacetum coccineum]